MPGVRVNASPGPASVPPAQCGAWWRRQAPGANQVFRRLEGRRRWPAESDAPAARTAPVRWLPPRPLAVRERREAPRPRLMDGAVPTAIASQSEAATVDVAFIVLRPLAFQEADGGKPSRRKGFRQGGATPPPHGLRCSAPAPASPTPRAVSTSSDSAPVDVPHHRAREPLGCAPVAARAQRRRSAAHGVPPWNARSRRSPSAAARCCCAGGGVTGDDAAATAQDSRSRR